MIHDHYMPANEKPRLRVTSSQHARVSYRGFRGEIFTDGRHFGWRAVIDGQSKHLRAHHDGESALAALVRECDRLADIAHTLVLADKFSGSGGLAVLEGQLDGAREQFEKLLQRLHKSDETAVEPTIAMMKHARKRKSIGCTVVETDGERVRIWPGLCIAVKGTRSYDNDEEQVHWIGDTAEHDSYNLHYLGTIEKITAKTVTIRKDVDSKIKRLRIAKFAWRNKRPVSRKVAQNRDTSMYI